MRKSFLFSIGFSMIAGLFDFFGIPNHFSNVIQLYWTWVGGAYIAHLIINKKQINAKYLLGALIAFGGLAFTVEKIFLLRDWIWAGLFLLVFLSFFSKTLVLDLKQKALNWIIGFMAIGGCFLLTYEEKILFHPVLVRYILLALIPFSLLLVLMPFIKVQMLIRWFLKPFIPLGSYSYAIYIYHWPILTLFIHYFNEQIHSNAIYMILITFLCFMFTLILSWYLELKAQPTIAQQMDKLYAHFNRNQI